ncbi:uroporphyrinogen-III synthase [Sphingobium sp. AR-3-1]|uniref:Uroporphyrinogen-III synthase n=1 Tax=Sphingobium psychrophilum TaxID=2728834 RepID=A0A7X9WVA8_9SPHN|nr:uroporphyrinogen-III synthase [Sphingobium psychrophilum]NML10488.1 uroporphyrinogen-III synthase [Sphingobium psychrophilum]
MNRVFILRPEPAAGRTAAKAAALDLDARVHPLFAPQPVAWTPPPPTDFEALLLTSAHGVRLAGPELAAYRGLPAYAVGEATARALRDAGFADVVAGVGDGSAIAARVAAHGHRRLLHLGGTTVAPMAADGIDVTRIAVYSMTSLPPDPALIADAVAGSILLVHSPRAGERLAAQIAQDARAALHIVAISPVALAACGAGWASGRAAARPVDDEMLALAARLCE